MADELADPDRLSSLLDEYGSPLNLIAPEAMARNASELASAAAERDVAHRLFFARKANKALALVDRARELGLGVDVASERELRQVLERGVTAGDVVVTAAVKPRGMLELCARSGATVAIDNADELGLLEAVAESAPRSCPVAVRLAPTDHEPPAPTRFGMPADEIRTVFAEPIGGLELTGVHFHLDGYSAADRAAAIAEALPLVDELREHGHAVGFLDIGGGVPMSYLDDEEDWRRFWEEHDRGLAGERDPITCDAHPIGKSYPAWQQPVRGEWLADVLDAPVGTGTVASALRDRGLELRLEPGRSILDGCGMTLARVEFRKRRPDGSWIAGLAMNRTQMRSTSDDFLVDPLLARPRGAGRPTEPLEAYLVGAYCIERELLTWRRMAFPEGIAVGDIVAFPNTAGYLMHILESASHQIPLAANLVVGDGRPRLDPIDS